MVLYENNPKTTVHVKNLEVSQHDETKGGSHLIYNSYIYISFCMPFCLLFLTPTAHWPVVCPKTPMELNIDQLMI